jgi:hypothetical protein
MGACFSYKVAPYNKVSTIAVSTIAFEKKMIDEVSSAVPDGAWRHDYPESDGPMTLVSNIWVAIGRDCMPNAERRIVEAKTEEQKIAIMRGIVGGIARQHGPSPGT